MREPFLNETDAPPRRRSLWTPTEFAPTKLARRLKNFLNTL